MPFLLMTYSPLYIGKNIYETEHEVLKRLILIYDLSEGYYDRRGRPDIWDDFLNKSDPGGVVIIKFNSMMHKERSFFGPEVDLRDPPIPSLTENNGI